MVAAFFPVETGLSGSAVVLQGTTVRCDESESAWSLMARAVQACQQRYSDSTFALEVAGSWGYPVTLTISRSSTFTLACDAVAAALTQFPAFSSGASSYTSGTISNVLVPQGLRMAPPGWSVGAPRVTADAMLAGPLRWQAGSVSCAVALGYDQAWYVVRALRSGIWDVVNEGMWLGRMRVTGTQMQPQGRLPGIVEVVVNGVAAP